MDSFTGLLGSLWSELGRIVLGHVEDEQPPVYRLPSDIIVATQTVVAPRFRQTFGGYAYRQTVAAIDGRSTTQSFEGATYTQTVTPPRYRVTYDG